MITPGTHYTDKRNMDTEHNSGTRYTDNRSMDTEHNRSMDTYKTSSGAVVWCSSLPKTLENTSYVLILIPILKFLEKPAK